MRFFTIFVVVFLFLIGGGIAKTRPVNDQVILRRAAHLINRATFGPQPGEIEELAKSGEAGLQTWINAQLNPKLIPDTDVQQELKKFPSLSMSNAQLIEAYPKQNKQNKKNGTEVNPDERPKQMLVELAAQKFILATESKKQLQEVLVDFWFNHFNVDFSKGKTKWFITSYERDVIRSNIFGKFSDLLKAVAKSPAMLFYLDNHESVKDGFIPKMGPKKKAKGGQMMPKGINENYARELMELHTLGVDGGYTQKDIINVARILTGWSISQEGEFKFRAQAHDQNAKKVLGVTYPAGGGEEEGIRLLEFLAKQTATARFISKKLIVHFVSDEPQPTLVEKLSKTFLATDGDLRAVYRELFNSPEFWTENNFESKIKPPFHLVASMIRALDGNVQVGSAQDMKKLDAALGQMGEPTYRCQPPTGFKDTAEFWVNPGALIMRMNTALAIAHQRIPAIDYDQAVFRATLRENKAYDGNKNALMYLDQWILGNILKPQTVSKISEELDQEPKILDEVDAKKKEATNASINLAKLLGLLLGSPEFQRY